MKSGEAEGARLFFVDGIACKTPEEAAALAEVDAGTLKGLLKFNSRCTANGRRITAARLEGPPAGGAAKEGGPAAETPAAERRPPLVRFPPGRRPCEKGLPPIPA